MGLGEELRREKISDFERGRRALSLLVTLHYARAAGVSADVLIDDELEPPEELPNKTKSEGVRSKASLKRRPGSKN